jgi:hypothetical protein
MTGAALNFAAHKHGCFLIDAYHPHQVYNSPPLGISRAMDRSMSHV